LEQRKVSVPEASPLPAGDGRFQPSSDPELDRLLGQVESMLEREQGVTAKLRALPTPIRRSIAGLAVIVAVGAIFLLAPRGDLRAFPVWAIVLTAVSYTAPLVFAVDRLIA